MSFTIVIYCFTFMVGFSLGKYYGWRKGKEEGRARAERILNLAMQTRASPTTHMALCCIAGNQTEQQMIAELKERRADIDGPGPRRFR